VPALGRGRLTRTNEATFDQLLPRTDGFGSGAAARAAADFFFGFAAPAPTQIPYSWLSPPFRARADQPINDVTVTQFGGGTAYQTSAASIARYGDSAAPYTLETAQDGDMQSLAAWVIDHYATSRMRCPSLTLNLFGPTRTDAEKWLVLGVTIGTRIQITGAPATWPEGTSTLIVEGIAHQVGGNVRLVTWNTSPVIGATPGVVGPWFKLNSSPINGTDTVPF
jgi:hypothetical protein